MPIVDKPLRSVEASLKKLAVPLKKIEASLTPIAFKDEVEERKYIANQLAKKNLKLIDPRKMQHVKKMLCEISNAAGLDKCVSAVFVKSDGDFFPYAHANTIVIPSNIVTTLKRENLYFVLAHEVAHVALKHTEKRSTDKIVQAVESGLKNYADIYKKENLDKITSLAKKGIEKTKFIAEIIPAELLKLYILAYGFYGVGVYYSNILPYQAKEYIFDTLFHYTFNRRQEYQADILSIYIMKKNNIPTDQVVGFLDGLSKKYEKKKKFLSQTHPHLGDRIGNIKKHGGEKIEGYVKNNDSRDALAAMLFFIYKLI